jgi:hypothetical protein
MEMVVHANSRVPRKTGNTKIDSSESTFYQPAFEAERLNKDAAHPKYKEYEAKQYYTKERGPQ